MSSPEPSDVTIEALVRAIAEAAVRELEVAGGIKGGGSGREVRGGADWEGRGGEAREGRGGGVSVGWLLGAPMSHGAALIREMGFLHRLGHGQRILCVPDAAAALAAAARVLPVGAQGVLGSVETITLDEPGGASALLESASTCEVLYVGALAWHQARALVAMEDRDPSVAVMLDALGAGRPLRVITGESLGGLHRFGRGRVPDGGGGDKRIEADGAVAREARRLWRELVALGADPVPVESLSGSLATRAEAQGSFARALGGLLTEKDVDQAVTEGRRVLVLPGRTVVTPLARDRARALGVVFEHGE